MVRGDPAAQRLGEIVVAEHAEILVRQVDRTLREHALDLVPLGRFGQPQAGTQALDHRVLAALAGEDEEDGGQQRGRVELLHHIRPERGEVRLARPLLRQVAAAPGLARVVAEDPVVVARDPDELRVDQVLHVEGFLLCRIARALGFGLCRHRRTCPGGRGLAGEQIVQALADHHVLEERNGPLLLQHDDGVTADGLEPVAELLGITHRGRQRDHRDRVRQVDDDLFPNRTAGAVGQVVHLVHHHIRQAEQRVRTGVQHVAQHLGGHHHDRRLGVDRVVPGQQADVLTAVPADEIAVLLVAERLDRGGVEALLPALERQVHRELADDGLARPSRRRDQHLMPVLQGGTRAQLEVVQLEVVQRAELGDRRVALVRAEICVLLGRGGHDARLCDATPNSRTPLARAYRWSRHRDDETIWVGLPLRRAVGAEAVPHQPMWKLSP